MSWPVFRHLVISDFTVRTVRSDKPLERGYRGDDVVCLTDQVLHMSW